MENTEAKQLKWEELGISNDFLFGKVMQDADLCKELLLTMWNIRNCKRQSKKTMKQRVSVWMCM